MPRRGLVRGAGAVMPCSEVLPTLRIVPLDLHIRITEADFDHGTLGIANVHRLLLLLAGSVEGLVERYLFTLILRHWMSV